MELLLGLLAESTLTGISTASRDKMLGRVGTDRLRARAHALFVLWYLSTFVYNVGIFIYLFLKPPPPQNLLKACGSIWDLGFQLQTFTALLQPRLFYKRVVRLFLL